MEDEPDPNEFLDWLCWMWAQSGERFYPPDETAKECMDALPDDHYTDVEEYGRALGWEEGQHTRAYGEAVDKFRVMEDWGFSPMERAAREHRDLMEKSDGSLEPLDWSWYYE